MSDRTGLLRRGPRHRVRRGVGTPCARDAVTYAMFAEILPDGKGRVYDGKRWLDTDPREIIAATRRAMLEEVV